MTCVQDCKCVMKYHQNEKFDEVFCPSHIGIKTLTCSKCKCTKCKHDYYISVTTNCCQCIFDQERLREEAKIKRAIEAKISEATKRENALIDNGQCKYLTIEEFHNLNQLAIECKCNDNHYIDYTGQKFYGTNYVSIAKKDHILLKLQHNLDV